MLDKPSLKVVKIGGNIIDNTILLKEILNNFSKIEGYKILIHGGGKCASDLAKRLGITTKMVEGRRITTTEMLEIATMVYAGRINKKLIAILQSRNCNAIGLSGADANIISSEIRSKTPVDFGLVGDIKKVNIDSLKLFLDNGITPVCCAITHDKKGQLLNTNADNIASSIACACTGNYDTTLYYCFEKKGVLEDVDRENSVISHIDENTYKNLKTKGIISDGMIPKLDNCFNALENGVSKVFIGDYNIISPNSKEMFTTLTLK